MDFIRKLNSRHLLKDCTKLTENFANKGIYCGFDPTAPSLHLGHLATLNALVYASSLKYDPIAIIGTSTGLIGDPSGKSESRPLIDSAKLSLNADLISAQLIKIFANLQRKAEIEEVPLKVIKNHEFYTNLNLIEFLREFGFYFPVNPLMSRDFIAQREDGVTFTEFSYSLLQAYDFFKLFQNFNCVGQIGGSDQWFNITSGTELIRKKTGKTAFGCTLPLLTTKDGKKFGKTEGNALFFDSSLTNPFDIYQYCYNQPDDMIESLLYKLTFVHETEIISMLKDPLENRTGQKRLGFEVLDALYGEKIAKGTQKVCEILSSGEFSKMNLEDFKILEELNKHVHVQKQDLTKEFSVILKDHKIFASGKEVRRMLENKSVRVNGEPVNIDVKLENLKWIEGKFCIVNIGKKNVYLLVLDN